MLKMVCDKCGKAVFTTSVESISMKNRITILDRQYDLCRECKLKVMMFIDGKMPYEDCEDCETHLKAQSKTEPTTERPSCETCRHKGESWSGEHCYNCYGRSKYEPQTEREGE